MKRQQIADGKVSGIGKELESLLESAIQTSRMVESEAREETVRNHILMELRKFRRRRRTVSADELVEQLRDFIPTHRVVRELEGMKEDGLLHFDGEHIGPETKIRLLSIRERTLEVES